MPKSNSKMKICVDFRKLNAHECRDLHMLPDVNKTFVKVMKNISVFETGRKIWAWAISLAEKSKSSFIRAFVVPVGMFCFKKKP